MNRRTPVLSILALGLAACGVTGSAAPAAHIVSARGPRQAAPACGPARRAWATEVSDSGRVIWRARLPTGPAQSGLALRPLVLGDEGVFAEYDGVYALRLRDGRQVWRRTFAAPKTDPFAGMVFGLWRWRGTVIVLTGQVSQAARLMSLDAATGAVRWTLRLPRQGLLGTQAITADGVLAMLVPDGVLEAADLNTGRLLWSRRNGTSPGPVVVGAVVAAGSDGRVIGYGSRTGAVRWTARGLPAEPLLTADDGLVLVRSDVTGAGWPTAVTALAPRSGRVAWRLDAGVPLTVLGAGQAGIVMSAYNPDRLYLVNPVTGRVRWSVATFAASPFPSPELIVTAGDVVEVEGRGTARLVIRRAADGTVAWSAPLTGTSAAGMHLALIPGTAVVPRPPIVPRMPVAPGMRVPPGRPGAAGAPGPEVAVTTGPPGAGTVSRLWVFRLGSGRLAGSTALPTLVQAPLAVAGTNILAQLDDPVCAIPLTGRAAGS